MTGDRPRHAHPRWTLRYRSLTVVLAVLVLVGVLAAARWPSGGTDPVDARLDAAGEAVTGSSAPAPEAATRLPAVPAQRRGAPVPEPPASTRLPSGTRVPVRTVTTGAQGVLDVPDDVGRAGWWSGGSKIGDPFGSTLVAGHVDSVSQGLGPFAELLEVDRGDRIVLDSAHLRQRFTITSRLLVPRESLADHPRFFSPAGARRLTFVTCAPPYDRAHGGYQNLAVVIADADAPAEPRR